MEVLKRNNVISSIRLNISCSDMKKKEYRKRFIYLMQYFSSKFVNEMELCKANELIKFAKEKDIPIRDDFFHIINHNNGSALCYIANYSRGTDVRPLISIDSPNFLSQWTFTIGHFSDVSVHLDSMSEKVFITTIDTLIEHDIYLLWVLEKVEEYFYSDAVLEDINISKSSLGIYNENGYYAYNDYSNYEFLIDIVDEQINRNKSVRIDTLKNKDGLTLKEYIKKNNIYKYCNLESHLFKICLEFGKPYKQVRTFVEKYGI